MINIFEKNNKSKEGLFSHYDFVKIAESKMDEMSRTIEQQLTDSGKKWDKKINDGVVSLKDVITLDSFSFPEDSVGAYTLKRILDRSAIYTYLTKELKSQQIYLKCIIQCPDKTANRTTYNLTFIADLRSLYGFSEEDRKAEEEAKMKKAKKNEKDKESAEEDEK